jgi:hypothetical protein
MRLSFHIALTLTSLVLGAGPGRGVDDYLRQGETATSSPAAESLPATQPTPVASIPTSDEALPGVIELSDGRQIAGDVFTTPGESWRVWVAQEKRWRLIPPAAVLSVSAQIVQEEMKLQWRWKATGEPQRVYTGQKYPLRRFLWTFRLADGSTITGVVKGQPIWVEAGGQAQGPFLLSERSKGKPGRTLENLVHIRKVVLSRTMMEKVRQTQKGLEPR